MQQNIRVSNIRQNKRTCRPSQFEVLSHDRRGPRVQRNLRRFIRQKIEENFSSLPARIRLSMKKKSNSNILYYFPLFLFPSFLTIGSPQWRDLSCFSLVSSLVESFVLKLDDRNFLLWLQKSFLPPGRIKVCNSFFQC